MQAIIFPLKEFEDWEAITPKTYPALKTFVGGAFLRPILAQQLRNMAGQMGYTTQNNNMYTILANNEDDDETLATDTTLMNVATMKAATLLAGNAMAATNSVHESVINAINQLSANQAALVQKMAAMPFNSLTSMDVYLRPLFLGLRNCVVNSLVLVLQASRRHQKLAVLFSYNCVVSVF